MQYNVVWCIKQALRLIFQLFAILLAHSLIKEIMIAKKGYSEATELRIDLHKVYDSTSPHAQ